MNEQAKINAIGTLKDVLASGHGNENKSPLSEDERKEVKSKMLELIKALKVD